MGLDDLAKRLADPGHIGLDSELAKRIGLVSPEAMRGRLMAETEDGRNHLGVYLLASYVVDDTDFWGDGEIYWWSIPAMLSTDGKISKKPLHGLPNGAPPHKGGSLEWVTNISLA
ncbi:MAG TPA: hypothetical protein PKD61_35430, partial [Polyangiaceae bacterium]|nr:hypothetical protein [Polyangiaceae bacterium]